MEMPKEPTYLVIYPEGKWQETTSSAEGRAIELPPHGRLVNIDDVYEAINREIVPKGIFLSDFYKAFADIPTVLEAST
jgi:hypothetical protein